MAEVEKAGCDEDDVVHMHQCPWCDRCFAKPVALTAHQKAVHYELLGSASHKVTGARYLSCDAHFAHQSRLLVHLRLYRPCHEFYELLPDLTPQEQKDQCRQFPAAKPEARLDPLVGVLSYTTMGSQSPRPCSHGYSAQTIQHQAHNVILADLKTDAMWSSPLYPLLGRYSAWLASYFTCSYWQMTLALLSFTGRGVVLLTAIGPDSRDSCLDVVWKKKL
eukprot:1185918-Amphidinium_carterae.1